MVWTSIRGFYFRHSIVVKTLTGVHMKVPAERKCLQNMFEIVTNYLV